MIHPETKAFAPPVRTMSEIERDDIVRRTLAEVETRMRGVSVNHTYRQAFKVVQRILDGMKPEFNETLNDTRSQISSISSRPV